jgi:hypothetical protein
MILTLYSFMDDNNNDGRDKKAYHELINFAMQGMGENAQFAIAIAVGIFGILAIFASINQHKEGFWENALWMQSDSIKFIGGVLSFAYWALVLFGMQTYVTRRLFEGILGKYLQKINGEGEEECLNNDIREIAKENKLANWIVRNIWLINKKGNRRYKGIYPFLICI